MDDIKSDEYWTGQPFKSNYVWPFGVIPGTKIADLTLCESLNECCRKAKDLNMKYFMAGPFDKGAGKKFPKPKIYIYRWGRAMTAKAVTNERQSNRTYSSKVYRTDLNIRAVRLFKAMASRAVSRNVYFDIDAEYILRKLKIGVCEATGIPFDMERAYSPFGPTLDKTNPNDGYTHGNTKVVCRIYNLMKSNFTTEDVERFLARVAETRNRALYTPTMCGGPS